MGIFNRTKANSVPAAAGVVQTARSNSHPYSQLYSYTPLSNAQLRLYAALREAVPIVDAAILKLTRLAGGFSVRCSDDTVHHDLNRFLQTVNVGGNQRGIHAFITSYLDQLLTYGTAVGEIVVQNGTVAALYNAPLEELEVRREPGGLDLEFYNRSGFSAPQKIKYPYLILYSALNPDPDKLTGNSILKGLPFLSDILLKIYQTIGVNWERVGNVRFAVNYKPQGGVGGTDAKAVAGQMAKQWSDAMTASGGVKDFVSVGDVSVKVIGAENQILDSEVPVRQMLEQIIAKTGLPPFMLGLNWSSTERMSSQQADMLTSELEAYRRVLTPVIERICDVWFRLNGYQCEHTIEWTDVTLQDEVEIAKARLYHAQAAKLEQESGVQEDAFGTYGTESGTHAGGTGTH